METLAKIHSIPAEQDQFIQENILNNAPIRPIAIAMNSNSALLVLLQTSHSGINSLMREILEYWEMKSTIRQIIVACMLQRLNAMKFRDDNPSIPSYNFKDHYVLVLNLTLLQDATQLCHYSELVRKPLRMELFFSSPLGNVTKSLYWVSVYLLMQSTSWCCGKESLKWLIFLLNR